MKRNIWEITSTVYTFILYIVRRFLNSKSMSPHCRHTQYGLSINQGPCLFVIFFK